MLNFLGQNIDFFFLKIEQYCPFPKIYCEHILLI